MCSLTSQVSFPEDAEKEDAGFDICLSGYIPIPPKEVEFFHLVSLIQCGPVPIKLEFTLMGEFGVTLQLTFCLISMKLRVDLTPNFRIIGEFSVALVIAVFQAGLKLKATVMDTQVRRCAQARSNGHSCRHCLHECTSNHALGLCLWTTLGATEIPHDDIAAVAILRPAMARRPAPNVPFILAHPAALAGAGVGGNRQHGQVAHLHLPRSRPYPYTPVLGAKRIRLN